ncbi:ParA family protein [Planobacterium oryzisoli]|uniref:ParA family protein n=1 Tax=Planobacterium oryzisoli TaxID=2771435 RepID=A0A930YV61_9FLAO|nr:ParA family protein [Planobacterium oryzisoli]MBF5026943.1 ParA family protein [Planobacterium oryzisoli]
MIISCTSPKGGSGKSTVSLFLSKYLAFKGYRVLLYSSDLSAVLPLERGTLNYEVSVEIQSFPEVSTLLQDVEQNKTPHTVQIVDLKDPLQFEILEVLELSDLIVIPCPPTALSIQSNLVFLSYLKEMELQHKVLVLFNQCSNIRKYSQIKTMEMHLLGTVQIIKQTLPNLALFEHIALQPITEEEFRILEPVFSPIYCLIK